MKSLFWLGLAIAVMVLAPPAMIVLMAGASVWAIGCSIDDEE